MLSISSRSPHTWSLRLYKFSTSFLSSASGGSAGSFTTLGSELFTGDDFAEEEEPQAAQAPFTGDDFTEEAEEAVAPPPLRRIV